MLFSVPTILLSASEISTPQLTLVGAVVSAVLALCTWVIKNAIARSDADSKAYRELLVTTLSDLRENFAAHADKQAALIETQRELAIVVREHMTETHKLLVVVQRTERMLLMRGHRDPQDDGPQGGMMATGR